MLPFPPLLFLFSYAPSCFPQSTVYVSVPFSAALSRSFSAWPNGDNMFRGDKQAHAAAEGSLGKAMVVCTIACVAARQPDKSPAVGVGDCLHHIVFRDIRCVSQCRWSLCGWMARCPEHCTSCVQITAVICKHWHRKTLDASFQHGGTWWCYAQRWCL